MQYLSLARVHQAEQEVNGFVVSMYWRRWTSTLVNFEVFGADRMQQFNIQLGEIMTVSFDIDAREYQGRWYNGVRAFRVDRNVQGAPMAAAAPVGPDTTPFGGAPVPTQAPAAPAAPAVETTPFAPQAEGEDLPF